MATKKTAKKQKQAEEQNRREVFGICLIALGLFFGAGLYSDAVGVVGRAISTFFFGIFGLVGYAIPVLIVAGGVLSIVFSENALRPSTLFLTLLFLIALLTLLQVHARPIVESVQFLEYYKDAYAYGTQYRAGGGMLGGMVS